MKFETRMLRRTFQFARFAHRHRLQNFAVCALSPRTRTLLNLKEFESLPDSLNRNPEISGDLTDAQALSAVHRRQRFFVDQGERVAERIFRRLHARHSKADGTDAPHGDFNPDRPRRRIENPARKFARSCDFDGFANQQFLQPHAVAAGGFLQSAAFGNAAILQRIFDYFFRHPEIFGDPHQGKSFDFINEFGILIGDSSAL